ncbi:DUF3152 domain-containing protein [Glycomyces halotolerans]
MARRRRFRRRRRIALVAVLILMAAAGTGLALAGRSGDGAPRALETGLPTSGPVGATALTEDLVPDVPTGTPEAPPPLYFSGTGTWTYAEARPGERLGASGTLLRYNVAVEDGLRLDPEEVSDFVHDTLADSRSWIAGGAWRFEQVGKGGADFTIYLASPEQRSVLCEHPNTTVSCRNGDRVVINSARWIAGVDHWDGTLETYRQYVVNHEVGHRLGHPHEVCPDEGELSPVMAQQTYKLAGCVGNAWPYPDGETYFEGPPGEYGGPELPPDEYADH